MNIKSIFLPSIQSFTGSFLLDREKAPSLASLTCKAKIKEIAGRCFNAVAITFCIALDICLWTLVTVTILPAIKLGKDHLINLIAVIVSPIFILFELCGYHARPCHTRRFHNPSGYLWQPAVTYEQWKKENAKAGGAPLPLKGDRFVRNEAGVGSLQNKELDFADCDTTLDSVKILVDLDKDIDKVDQQGLTFLHRLLASRNRLVHILRRDSEFTSIQKILNFLFKEKNLNINLNIIDNMGLRSLEVYLFYPPTNPNETMLSNYFDIANLLLERGAELDLGFEEFRDALVKARDQFGLDQDDLRYVRHRKDGIHEKRKALIAEFESSSNRYVKFCVHWNNIDRYVGYSKVNFNAIIKHVEALIAWRNKKVRAGLDELFPDSPWPNICNIVMGYY